MGQLVKRILKRDLLVFPKLQHNTEAKDMVAFYEGLHQVSTAYLLPLMPIAAICLTNNYEGLYPQASAPWSMQNAAPFYWKSFHGSSQQITQKAWLRSRLSQARCKMDRTFFGT
jgi:hypothetical protein